MNQEKVSNTMEKITNWLQGNDPLQAVSSGLGLTVGITLVGSIFSILRQIPFGWYQSFIESTGLKALFNVPVQYTTNFFAVFASIAVAYYYCRRKNQDGFMSGLLSMFVFFSLACPNGLDASYLGSQGLFLGMLVGLLTGWLTTTVKEKGWYIHMPDSVPPFMAKSFESISSCAALGIIVVVLNAIFTNTSAGSVNAWLYSTIQAPLSNVGGTAPAIVFGVFICQLFWWFGVHGTAILAAIYMPILMSLNVENLTAYNAGLPLPNMYTFDTLTIAFAGGTGGTLGLVLAMVLKAKSQQYKSVGKLALVPSIFGVNEPVIFGTPICLNPRMFLPWVGMPTVMTAIGCFLTKIGIIAPYNGLHVNGIPSFISSFMYTNVGGGIFTFIVIAVSFVVYWYFGAKAMDDEAYAQEQASENN